MNFKQRKRPCKHSKRHVVVPHFLPKTSHQQINISVSSITRLNIISTTLDSKYRSWQLRGFVVMLLTKSLTGLITYVAELIAVLVSSPIGHGNSSTPSPRTTATTPTKPTTASNRPRRQHLTHRLRMCPIRGHLETHARPFRNAHPPREAKNAIPAKKIPIGTSSIMRFARVMSPKQFFWPSATRGRQFHLDGIAATADGGALDRVACVTLLTKRFIQVMVGLQPGVAADGNAQQRIVRLKAEVAQLRNRDNQATTAEASQPSVITALAKQSSKPAPANPTNPGRYSRALDNSGAILCSTRPSMRTFCQRLTILRNTQVFACSYNAAYNQPTCSSSFRNVPKQFLRALRAGVSPHNKTFTATPNSRTRPPFRTSSTLVAQMETAPPDNTHARHRTLTQLQKQNLVSVELTLRWRRSRDNFFTFAICATTLVT